MRTRRGDGRILIYSHDTFGLGHLRRCRTIAHSLVERFKQLSVLILSGSPIIGSFDFKARVDFVRVPGVIKLRNGEYTPLNLHLDIRETMAMRASIIQHTAEAFGPDMFIVDKEPVGPARRADADAEDAQAQRHAPGARPARRDGRAAPARAGVAAQEGDPGAARPLRRDLGLRPAADLRSARRHRAAGARAREDGLHRLPAPRGADARRAAAPAGDRQQAVPAGHHRRRRRRRGADRLGAARLRARPAAAAIRRCWCSGRSCRPSARPNSWTAPRS